MSASSWRPNNRYRTGGVKNEIFEICSDFFAIVDFIIFLISQANPSLLVVILPQFDIESAGSSYPRLVGILFMMLGLVRLYGAIFIDQKGAFVLAMWSWVVELIYTISELSRGQFALTENVLGLTLAPIMLIWSVQYYRAHFQQS
ncbi:MAG: hypothetical protein ACR2O1_11380 [Boseongicola sp.]